MIDATASSCRRCAAVASGQLRILREQQQRDQHVVERDAPAFGRAAQRRVLRRVEREERECVVAVLDRAIPRPDRPAAARRHRRQPRQGRATKRSGCRREEPPVRRADRVAKAARRRRRAGVAVDDRVQQHDDRIAAGDEVVVGDAEEERVVRRRARRSGTDRSGPSRGNGRFSCRSNLCASVACQSCAGGDDLERARPGPAALLVASARGGRARGPSGRRAPASRRSRAWPRSIERRAMCAA